MARAPVAALPRRCPVRGGSRRLSRPLIAPSGSASKQLSLGALLLIDVLEFGIDDLVLAGPAWRRRLVPGTACLGLRGLVDGFAELAGNLGQGAAFRFDLPGIVAADRGFEVGQGPVDGGLVRGIELVAVLGQGLFRRMDQAFGLIAG